MAPELSMDSITEPPRKRPRRRKIQSDNRLDLAKMKMFEDAEKSDLKVAGEKGELWDKELWFFKLPKDVSSVLITRL